MSLSDLDPDAHLGDPARKQRYVTTLFDTIAPHYDRFTRLFSFGMDGAWKRRMARWVADVVGPGDLVLDLACGTGDILWRVHRCVEGQANERTPGSTPRMDGISAEATRRAGVRLVGADPSAAMLRLARHRLAHSGMASGSPTVSPSHPPVRRSVSLLRADMMSLPLGDGVAATVTVGYGFRNTPNAAGALGEVARVLKPGGWLLDLDFFLPEGRRWRQLYLGYLRRAGRAVGRWWHDEPEAYGYIARSLERWITPREFERMLEAAGFRLERAHEYLGGGICLHGARRAA